MTTLRSDFAARTTLTEGRCSVAPLTSTGARCGLPMVNKVLRLPAAHYRIPLGTRYVP